MSVLSLKGLLLLTLDKRDYLVNKNEKFYKPTIKNVLPRISGSPDHGFEGCIQAGDIYSGLEKTILQQLLECNMARVFNEKIWFMDGCMFKHMQASSWKWKGSRNGAIFL